MTPNGLDLEKLVTEWSQRATENARTFQDLQVENAKLAARLAAVEDLVRHCWVHSGHADCGWKQMDGPMRLLYQQIIRPDCTPADAGEGN
jgi:hypothetical protein